MRSQVDLHYHVICHSCLDHGGNKSPALCHRRAIVDIVSRFIAQSLIGILWVAF